MTVLDKVRQITAQDHGLGVEEVMPDTDFFQDLGDSLNVVETVIACEEEFGVEVPDEDLTPGG